PAEVRQVALVGDFNGWDSDSTVMRRSSADGAWSTKVPLGPGVHNYAFVVDGQRWLVDPMAPQVPDRGFGPANAVVVVGSRSCTPVPRRSCSGWWERTVPLPTWRWPRYLPSDLWKIRFSARTSCSTSRVSTVRQR